MRRLCLAVLLLLALLASPRVLAAKKPARAIPAGMIGLGDYVHAQEATSDHYLEGLFGQCVIHFNTGDWDIHLAQLDLCYSTTQRLRYDECTLTVRLNGEAVYTADIPATAGERKWLTIPLPAESVKPESLNAIAIETYSRSDNEDPCIDDVASGNWFNVFAESTAFVSYTALAEVENIADFYKGFTSIEALENNQSAVILADDEAASVRCAAMALSGLSGNAALHYDNIALGQYGRRDWPREIIIGMLDELPNDVLALLSPSQVSSAKMGAVAALVKTAAGQALVVTGSDPEALGNAGSMLANAEYMAQLLSDSKVILAESDYAMREELEMQYVPLTQSGVTVQGVFRQSASFYVAYPAYRNVSTGSELYIEFRYADNLDFDRSLMTVFINDVPIGSKKLTRELAGGDSATFPIPDDLHIYGSFSVEVAFDLEGDEWWCRLEPEEMPWAYVAETSMFKLNTADPPALSFKSYPSPFVRDGRLNEVTLVLPEEPEAEELECVRRVFLTLGRYLLTNAGGLRVSMGATDDLGEQNVIAIGAARHNRLLDECADLLHLRYSADGATLKSSDKLLIDPGFGYVAGTGQLLYSPFSQKNHAVLILTGVTAAGALEAADCLFDSTKLWSLSGDGFAAYGEDLLVRSFAADPESVEQPVQTQPAAEIFTVPVYMLVAYMTIGLAGLAVLLFIWKALRGQGRR